MMQSSGWFVFEQSAKARTGWDKVSKGFNTYSTAKLWYDAMMASQPNRKLCICNA